MSHRKEAVVPRKFSPAVEKALAEVCPSDDPLDSPDFDAVRYLNEKFPDEASLKNLPAFYEKVKSQLQSAESELLHTVKTQATTTSLAAKDLVDTQSAVEQLQERVSDIKDKAAESEEKVRILCQNIRQLDTAKSNLSISVKTLKKLQVWMIQVQKLQIACEQKNFVDSRDFLEEALEHSAYFEEFKDVPKIKEMRERVDNICKKLAWHAQNMFVVDADVDEETLRNACLVADLIGKDCYEIIVKKFIEKELEVYHMKFKRGTEDAQFQRTERRYGHIRALLDKNESLFDNVFPKHWCVLQELCLEFCLKTKVELDHALEEVAGNVDVAVLIFVLQKTIEIEKDLTNRARYRENFPGRERMPEYKFNNFLLKCFDAHMGLYVQQENELMQRIVVPEDVIPASEFQDDVSNLRVGATLSSSDDIFFFIKESLKRASSLSQKQTLVDVSDVWLKQLCRYNRALFNGIVTIPTTTKEERNIAIIINTAEKCRKTTEELGVALLGSDGRIDALGGDKIDPKQLMCDFQTTVDQFAELYVRGVLCLVSAVERDIALPIQEFITGRRPGGTAGIDLGAQDKSPYVINFKRIVESHVISIATVLNVDSLKYFIDKLSSKIIPLYTNGLYKLHNVTEMQVNQMRLDGMAMLQCMLQLPNAGDPSRFSQSTLSSYNKRVQREFHRMDMALKILQCDIGESFIEIYLNAIPENDRSVQHFSALLELKGLKGEALRPWLTTLRKSGVPDATKFDAALGKSTVSLDPAVTTSSSTASGGPNIMGVTSTNLRKQIDKSIVSPFQFLNAMKGMGGGTGNAATGTGTKK